MEAGLAQSRNPSIFEVPEGERLVFIQVKVENISAEPWKSSVAQFFLRDASGEDYSPSLYPTDKGDMLPQKEMARGDVSTGYIGYEIPEEVSDLILAYAVRLDQGKAILVNLDGVE